MEAFIKYDITESNNIFLKSKYLIVEVLTSNSVGTQLFFLGCNQDNNPGSNYITKKKNLLGSTRKGN